MEAGTRMKYYTKDCTRIARFERHGKGFNHLCIPVPLPQGEKTLLNAFISAKILELPFAPCAMIMTGAMDAPLVL